MKEEGLVCQQWITKQLGKNIMKQIMNEKNNWNQMTNADMMEGCKKISQDMKTGKAAGDLLKC